LSRRLIDPIRRPRLQLRLLDSADLLTTLAWCNQDRVRRWFVHTQPPTRQKHRSRFVNALQRVDDRLLVIQETERLQKSVGQVPLLIRNPAEGPVAPLIGGRAVVADPGTRTDTGLYLETPGSSWLVDPARDVHDLDRSLREWERAGAFLESPVIPELMLWFEPRGDLSRSEEMAGFEWRAGKVLGCCFVVNQVVFLTANGWLQSGWTLNSGGFHIGRSEPRRGPDALKIGPKMTRRRRALSLDRRDETRDRSGCGFSFPGLLGADSVGRLWNGRDDQGLHWGQGERTDTVGHVAPTPHRQVRVDLGCGPTKRPGFIGVDRFPLPGVDIVSDLDEPLPFADDSVDLVVASHSLEHIEDLSKTIREVYRICKHGAQICIVAPYYQQSLNLANPYHKQVFNEHTPRFWTASAVTTVDPQEYDHPHARSWGLLTSDHSTADIDIRCATIEFLYFPAYRNLPADVQRWHRTHEWDVCDQIVYRLLAIKRPITDEEFINMTRAMEHFEPYHLELRKMHERCEELEADARRVRQRNDELLGELGERTAKHAAEIEEVLARAELYSKSSEVLLHRLNAASQSELELRQHIITLTSGTSWRAVQLLLRVRHRLAPAGSLRERIGRWLMQSQRWARALVRRRVAAGP
jgi:SAM-dependent methyltransferase